MNTVRLECPHASECPGCPLYEIDYLRTLEEKAARLSKNVGRYSELAHVPTSKTVAADPVIRYRRRAKLVVDEARVGLYSREGHHVLDLPECRILEPALGETVRALRTLLPASLPLRAVDLRNTPEGVFVTFVVDEGIPLEQAQSGVERLRRGLPHLAGTAVSFRPHKSAQLLGRDLKVLSGPSRIRVSHSSSVYAYETHGAFAQAHPAQERALEAAVLRALEDEVGGLTGKRVLELFSGSGRLSLRMASLGADVTAVEAYAPAANLARAAAEEQSLRLAVHAQDATAVVQASARTGDHFDAIIVNPPRRGLAAALRAAIASLGPPVFVYVSCCPETLARDAADLARKGFTPRGFAPYDMMPWTDQVETLAVFTPGSPPPLEIIVADERLIAVVKAPHEPTTPQGEHHRSLLDRVRAQLSHEAVPVHPLDIGTSGVCLFARSPGHVPALSRALAEGGEDYIALGRGIARPKGSIHRAVVSGGRPLEARTRYKRVQVVAGHSLLRVRPEQGRKHQIRVHLASIGHPILGDARYGDRASNEYFELRHGLDRPFLHCERVTLRVGGGVIELVARLAPDLVAVVESMQSSGE